MKRCITRTKVFVKDDVVGLPQFDVARVIADNLGRLAQKLSLPHQGLMKFESVSTLTKECFPNGNSCMADYTLIYEFTKVCKSNASRSEAILSLRPKEPGSNMPLMLNFNVYTAGGDRSNGVCVLALSFKFVGFSFFENTTVHCSVRGNRD